MPDTKFIKYLHAIALKRQKLCKQFTEPFLSHYYAIYATEDEQGFFSILEMHSTFSNDKDRTLTFFLSKYYCLKPYIFIYAYEPLKVTKEQKNHILFHLHDFSVDKTWTVFTATWNVESGLNSWMHKRCKTFMGFHVLLITILWHTFTILCKWKTEIPPIFGCFIFHCLTIERNDDAIDNNITTYNSANNIRPCNRINCFLSVLFLFAQRFCFGFASIETYVHDLWID